MTSDLRIPLRDGRHIGAVIHGAPEGRPIVWLGGLGASRRWVPPDAELLRALDARLVVVERPGYGLSEFREGGTFLDWPEDLAQVLDALSLSRVALLGASGAGPFLCASALRLADRVTVLGTLGCIAPTRDGLSHRRNLIMEFALRSPASFLAVLDGKTAEQVLDEASSDAPPCDRAIIDANHGDLVAMFEEAFRDGPRSYAWEMHLIAGAWGFRVEDIRVPVRLWHGTLDVSAPIAMGRHLAAAIPGCHATFLEGAGHFFYYDHWRDIVSEVLAIDASRSS